MQRIYQERPKSRGSLRLHENPDRFNSWRTEATPRWMSIFTGKGRRGKELHNLGIELPTFLKALTRPVPRGSWRAFASETTIAFGPPFVKRALRSPRKLARPATLSRLFYHTARRNRRFGSPCPRTVPLSPAARVRTRVPAPPDFETVILKREVACF